MVLQYEKDLKLKIVEKKLKIKKLKSNQIHKEKEKLLNI
jgi:hypothetical protein